MGLQPGENYPGLVVVGAVTEDFASAIISPDGQKKDHDYVRPKLEHSARYSALGARADRGMRFLEQNCLALERPSDEDVRVTVERLHGLYSRAYDWKPPAYEVTAGGRISGADALQSTCRNNEWDLRRPAFGL